MSKTKCKIGINASSISPKETHSVFLIAFKFWFPGKKDQSYCFFYWCLENNNFYIIKCWFIDFQKPLKYPYPKGLSIYNAIFLPDFQESTGQKNNIFICPVLCNSDSVCSILLDFGWVYLDSFYFDTLDLILSKVSFSKTFFWFFKQF